MFAVDSSFGGTDKITGYDGSLARENLDNFRSEFQRSIEQLNDAYIELMEGLQSTWGSPNAVEFDKLSASYQTELAQCVVEGNSMLIRAASAVNSMARANGTSFSYGNKIESIDDVHPALHDNCDGVVGMNVQAVETLFEEFNKKVDKALNLLSQVPSSIAVYDDTGSIRNLFNSKINDLKNRINDSIKAMNNKLSTSFTEDKDNIVSGVARSESILQSGSGSGTDSTIDISQLNPGPGYIDVTPEISTLYGAPDITPWPEVINPIDPGVSTLYGAPDITPWPEVINPIDPGVSTLYGAPDITPGSGYIDISPEISTKYGAPDINPGSGIIDMIDPGVSTLYGAPDITPGSGYIDISPEISTKYGAPDINPGSGIIDMIDPGVSTLYGAPDITPGSGYVDISPEISTKYGAPDINPGSGIIDMIDPGVSTLYGAPDITPGSGYIDISPEISTKYGAPDINPGSGIIDMIDPGVSTLYGAPDITPGSGYIDISPEISTKYGAPDIAQPGAVENSVPVSDETKDNN